jgi:hypothetical protein
MVARLRVAKPCEWTDRQMLDEAATRRPHPRVTTSADQTVAFAIRSVHSASG